MRRRKRRTWIGMKFNHPQLIGGKKIMTLVAATAWCFVAHERSECNVCIYFGIRMVFWFVSASIWGGWGLGTILLVNLQGYFMWPERHLEQVRVAAPRWSLDPEHTDASDLIIGQSLSITLIARPVGWIWGGGFVFAMLLWRISLFTLKTS